MPPVTTKLNCMSYILTPPYPQWHVKILILLKCGQRLYKRIVPVCLLKVWRWNLLADNGPLFIGYRRDRPLGCAVRFEPSTLGYLENVPAYARSTAAHRLVNYTTKVVNTKIGITPPLNGYFSSSLPDIGETRLPSFNIDRYLMDLWLLTFT